MQRLTIALVFIFAIYPLQTSPAEETANSVKVMTFNIRYGSANDGDNAWPQRQEMVLERIRSYGPDLLGLQEALRGQLDFISEALPEYSVLGTGREADGGGEYSPLLYNCKRFDVIAAGTFWLSDTPQKPGSVTWGNSNTRICTWARLFDRQTGERIAVYNTHWDHQSQPAREKGSQQIAAFAAKQQAGPVIVMGDFNSGEENPALKPLVSMGLRDSFRDLYPEMTEVGTFNGFGKRLSDNKIDGVFVSSHWQVREAAIDRSQPEGQFPSDHFPVSATLEYRSK